MKLLMENFRQFIVEEEIEKYIKENNSLVEQDLRKFIKELYSQKNLVITEQQLDEAIPAWMKKWGARAGLAASLAGIGAGPAQAQADDTFADMFAKELAATQSEGDLELSTEVGKNLATKIFDDIKDNLPSNTPIQDGVEIVGAQALDLNGEAVNKSFHETMKSSLEKNNLQSGENFGTMSPGDNFGVKVNLMPVSSDSAEDAGKVMVQVALLNKGKVVSTYSFNTAL
tara:strand:- start:269 stop:952 length:684 start_codon:yes stop_codon:yes gene_type:complete